MRAGFRGFVRRGLGFVVSLVVMVTWCGCASTLMGKPKSGASTDPKRLQDINVSFYPGQARLEVTGHPELATTAPCVLKLARPDNKLSKLTYEIILTADGRKLEPIHIDYLYGQLNSQGVRGTLGWWKTYLKGAGKMSSVDTFHPTQVYAIDKEGAIRAGEIKPVVQALESEVEWVRRDAAEALGALKQDAATDPLLRALDDGSTEVQLAVIRALGNMEATRAVPALCSKVGDDRPAVSLEAAMALRTMNVPEHEKLLAEKLGHSSGVKRAMYLDELRRFPCDLARDLAAGSLADGNPLVVKAALGCLTEIGEDPAIAPVTGEVLLKSKDIEMLTTAVECLQKINAQRSADVLLEKVAAGGETECLAAAFALGQLRTGADSALPVLMGKLGDDRSLVLRKKDCHLVELAPNSVRTTALSSMAIDEYWQPGTQSTITLEKAELGYSPTMAYLGAVMVGEMLAGGLVAALFGDQESKEEEEARQIISTKCEINTLLELGRTLGMAADIESYQKAGELKELRAKLASTPSSPITLEQVRQERAEVEAILKQRCTVEELKSTLKGNVVTVEAAVSLKPVKFALANLSGQDFGADTAAWTAWWGGRRGTSGGH